ncbi:MAG: JAB domain-containing protein [Deltaproteobacteria bacterium]|nr:JAB domain-containing protein [Deltaproteobacteria bacterium]
MYKSDRELLSELLEIPEQEMRGDTIPDLLDSIPDERVDLVREIACRYGEKRIVGQSFDSARQVYDHFKIRLGTARQEEFHVLILDNKHRVVEEKMITLGTLNQSLIHPREIFAPAIELRAASIILIHSHPSGDVQPSNQDIEITKRLSKVGEIMGIKVLDHVIIGEDYFSFVDQDMMQV